MLRKNLNKFGWTIAKRETIVYINYWSTSQCGGWPFCLKKPHKVRFPSSFHTSFIQWSNLTVKLFPEIIFFHWNGEVRALLWSYWKIKHLRPEFHYQITILNKFIFSSCLKVLDIIYTASTTSFTHQRFVHTYVINEVFCTRKIPQVYMAQNIV